MYKIKEEWRLIESGYNTGYFNMAFDEVLLESYIKKKTKPVIRFYQWKPPTISIGRNQSINEINVEACKKLNIDIVKRPTGGKAVLHEGEFTYSIIYGKKDNMHDDLLESYKVISNALIKGLEKLQVQISTGSKEENKNYGKNSFCFSSVTTADLQYFGKKIIGSSQLRRHNCLLQHGSILINQNFDLLKEIFKEDLNSLINLKDIIGFTPSYKEIKEVLIKGFEEYFNIILKPDYLNKYEKVLLEEYCLKYKNIL